MTSGNFYKTNTIKPSNFILKSLRYRKAKCKKCRILMMNFRLYKECVNLSIARLALQYL